ncbi:MAG TPA: efflux RND transporter periplasmic adaptor subunit [Vicinamibacterales bacterium]|nr:efflux RND transporter periplasmic adaptor subunit [Vicinamibacterales bacterium]
MTRRVIAIAVGAALAIGVVSWVLKQTTHAAVQYQTAAVTRGSVDRTVIASGTVNPVTVVQVGTYVSGVVQQVYCDYNTSVTKGQLCARIDPRPYQSVVEQDSANLAAAKAQLDKDQANLQYAQLTADRNQKLGTQGLVPQDTVDSSKSAANQARAQVEVDKTGIDQRQAELDAARINLGYTDIVSPVDGTVVARNVTTGQTVAASFQTPTLFLIATDLTKMQVDANVSESDIGNAKAGSSASFSVEAYPDRTFWGTVTQVRQAPQTVQNVVTYDVVISVPNPDLVLKPGMTATVHIVSDERKDVLRVPVTALRFVPGGVNETHGAAREASDEIGEELGNQGRVWTLRENHPNAVPVSIGLEGDTFAEIQSGALAPGDQVVVSEKSGGAAATRPTRPRLFGL